MRREHSRNNIIMHRDYEHLSYLNTCDANDQLFDFIIFLMAILNGT